MCVGITPPCSKCGAPARWKMTISASKKSVERLTNIFTWVQDNLEDDCPIKETLINLLEGRHE